MATKYVATTGNDTTGTGAVGAPWATLNKGLASTPVGDTLQLRAGTYAQAFRNGRDTIIIENYPGENVVIQRTSIGSVIGLENCRNVTIRKNASGGTFTVRSTLTSHTGSSSGIFVYMAGGGSPGFVPSNDTVDGIIVESISGYGIQMADVSVAIVKNVDVSHTGSGIRYRRVSGASFIQDSASHHNDRMIVSDATANNDNGGMGIELNTAVGVTVQRNRLYENHAVSVDYGHDGGAVELFQSSQCVIQDNIAYNNNGFCETGTGNATTYPMPDNIVRRNLVYGSVAYEPTDPGMFMFIRAGSNLQIYNNTVDIDDGNSVIYIQGAAGGYSAPIHNLKIKNNLLVSRASGTALYKIYNVSGTTGIEIDYNLLYNSVGSGNQYVDANNYGGSRTGTGLAAFRSASPFSDHDIWNDDPDFVNRTVRDYTLQGTSPAINAGAAIPGTTTGYVGSAPDIGRFEYASVPVPDVDANANFASGTGSAKNATVTTTSTVSAVQASAGVASGTGAAYLGDPVDNANVILASGTGSAKNATVTTTSTVSAVQAAAGAALGVGSAYLGDTGPDAPVITYPASDGTSTNGIVVLSGTAEAGVLVELFDGVTSVGTTNAVGTAFSFNLPAVSVGVHTYTAKATNVAGVTSGASNARVITVETTAPEVSTSIPADGATGVAVGSNVVVTFSEAMDPATITTASFRVLRSGVPVAGTITMSAGDTVATFNPTADLAAGTTYIVELTSVIKDVAGNSLTA